MLTIATKNRRLSMKLDEIESEQIFEQLVLGLMKSDKAHQNELNEPEYQSHKEVSLPAPEKVKYKGFMYIRCLHCGRTRGFNSKYDISFYKCNDCEQKTELDLLKELYINCECGRQFKYLTNIEEPIFDMNCIDCGSLVPVQLNKKKDIFETIR